MNKIIITSTPKGNNNFMEIYKNSMREDKSKDLLDFKCDICNYNHVMPLSNYNIWWNHNGNNKQYLLNDNHVYDYFICYCGTFNKIGCVEIMNKSRLIKINNLIGENRQE